jgi:hypothetical protein
MRRSNTVGWDSVHGELNFIADDPGPLLVVAPEMMAQATHQRDGTWLLRGMLSTDRSMVCEFTVLTSVYHLALSLVPLAPATSLSQVAAPEPSDAQETLQGWVPAPPQPASGRPPPVSFYTPREIQVAEPQWTEDIEEVATPAAEVVDSVDTGGYLHAEDWIVTFVGTDPRKPDETAERSLRFKASSDAEALRALHAELRKTSEEPSYRVISIAPARQVSEAA